MSDSIDQEQDNLLGQEFLTWLWYTSERQNGLFSTPQGEHFGLWPEQRITVQGGEGQAKETASVSGLLSELREARHGLAAGKKVSKAQLRLEVDSAVWTLTLKAEDFSLTGCKTPKIETTPEEGQDPDAAFLEKLYLLDRAVALVDIVFAEFVQRRFSDDWQTLCQQIGTWMHNEQ